MEVFGSLVLRQVNKNYLIRYMKSDGNILTIYGFLQVDSLNPEKTFLQYLQIQLLMMIILYSISNLLKLLKFL